MPETASRSAHADGSTWKSRRRSASSANSRCRRELESVATSSGRRTIMNFSRPTIVTCAVTGNLAQPSQSPYLPITPAQIAQSCIEAAGAGAAIVHIHVRDPETGAPSMDIDLYGQVVDRIRKSGTDVIINLTTGPGQRFVPGREEPAVAGPGTSLMRGEATAASVEALR